MNQPCNRCGTDVKVIRINPRGALCKACKPLQMAMHRRTYKRRIKEELERDGSIDDLPPRDEIKAIKHINLPAAVYTVLDCYRAPGGIRPMEEFDRRELVLLILDEMLPIGTHIQGGGSEWRYNGASFVKVT